MIGWTAEIEVPTNSYRKGRVKVKVHKKITLFLTVLFLASMVWIPTTGQAKTEYNYGNQSCGPDRATDVIFVINDSKAMMAIDISSDPTVQATYISEAIKFTESFQGKDRVGVIGFNEKAVQHQLLTTNRIDSKRALNTFLTVDGNTAGGNDLSTGISMALNEFKNSNSTNEKVMIIMTTGDSIENQKSLELARQAYEEQITIHVFGFGSSMNIDETNLTSIAQKTGGNYFYSARATDLAKSLASVKSSDVASFSGREVSSDWKLTNHANESAGLLIKDNVKVDLNGYNLTVAGDLVLQSCAELRAVSSVITAKNIEQKSGSMISLNNSQLNVSHTFTQNGLLRVNGAYKWATPEVLLNIYNQKINGVLDLNGRSITVAGNFDQEGRVQAGAGTIEVTGSIVQEGFFNLQKGKLLVKGNLEIKGENLRGEAFTENRSLNVDGGVVQVGSAESMAVTREKGSIRQTSGQLFVNHGTVRIFGDYAIADGWLTMIKGSMDTASSEYGEGDGDYVHVYRDFSTSSQRNHAERKYTHVGKPMHDQGHLTDGVLRVDGNFTQIGNAEFNANYSDRFQNYTEDYSRFNFSAAGRHKVLLTGKGKIQVQSTGFTFNHLEVNGRLADYQQTGSARYKKLTERAVSANAKLTSLSINGISVNGFNPNSTNYLNHVVPAGSFQALSVDARAEDRNAKVEVMNNAVVNGKAQVIVIVTATDGSTMTYNVNVTVGSGTDGRVTSITFKQRELTFLETNGSIYSPSRATIGYTISPTNATNQQVIWTSTNEAVAIVTNGVVTPVGVGEASIIATTVDGNFVDSATVKVLLPFDLLEGIKTLADLVSDNNRYDQIMSIYDYNSIGIVVPGKYIQKVTFKPNASGHLISGEIATDTDVSRIIVRVNGYDLPVPTNPLNPNSYTFSRILSVNDSIEVIAFNSAGDELEQITTHYPIGFEPDTSIPFGFNSIQTLLTNPYLFDLILDYYSLDQLRFEAK